MLITASRPLYRRIRVRALSEQGELAVDQFYILVAFALGLAARQVGLPPLVGYLFAGFALNAMNVQGGSMLAEIADLGILLLLFSIGLKLKLSSLARPEVWGGASIHMLLTVIVFGAGIFGLSVAGLTRFSELSFQTAILVAFALSFSSTVFAVKVLEEKGEMGSLHGRTAIGILIVQDVFAIIFLTISLGTMPSPWALLLLGLIPLRPVLRLIMSRCGHGELLVLFGLFAAVGGASAFEQVGLKPDLGALLLGVLLAGSRGSSELARDLLGFKDLFLVGFFLQIGIKGAPTPTDLGIAALLALVMPIKVAGFFLLLTRFRLRARTSLFASLNLANYSEFGLIVGAVGVNKGWIGNEWLVIISLALAMTFVIASPLNRVAHAIYLRFENRLRRFETDERHPEEQPIEAGDAEVVVFGMGRIGAGVYDVMCERYGDVVVGVDFNSEVVRSHQEKGRRVLSGDATNPDFWQRVRRSDFSAFIKALSSSRRMRKFL